MPVKSFAVIGLGRFGAYVARQLRSNGCEVLGVDKNRARVEGMSEVLTTALIADATDKKALARLELGQMDAVVVCLGDIIDASTLAVLHLKELKVRRVVAKVSSEDHAKVLSRLGAESVVFPQRDLAIRLANNLTWSNVLDYVPLSAGYSITKVAPPKDVVGKPLGESRVASKYGVQVIAVQQVVKGDMVLAPTAEQVVEEDDAIIVLGKRENIEKLLNSGT